jgi:predicted ATPase/class 3 adenylate cyclase
MAEQPRGTVSFFFSDIEGSTRLLAELGAERYAQVLREHHRLLRGAFSRYQGYEVDCEGDAFFVAFQSAESAVRAAADIQRALAAHEWPEGSDLRVRIGIHTGEALLEPPKYVGMEVHRTARIMAAGHGGQVLLSTTTRDLVNASVRDLGAHRLKDLSEPQRLYQLGEDDFPPLKTLYQTNLPVPATPFLGRERELGEVRALLLRDDVRLLTLTGPGGTGKTRLGLQAVADVADFYPDGVFWVPLAPLRDPKLVVETAAHALGAKEGLVEHVADWRTLILLDNFEQLVEASGEIAAVLAACPRLDLLVTSRERLQLAAEHEWPVPPLERSDAVDLFEQRMRALGVTPGANGAAAELCAHLDDLPLALELAAARTKLFSPEQLLERLGQRLDLLKGGRDVDPRQQTLRATIQWSYDLLTAEEQTLFARLAVFTGGCTLEAAEVVCDADPETLASLLDKSLLRRRGDRFWMLETIREFAAERLEQLANRDAIRRALAEWCVRLAEPLWDPVREGDAVATATIEAELDNFRSVLDWAVEHSEPRFVLKLVSAVGFFWVSRGYTRESLHWAERATEAAERVPAAEAARSMVEVSEIIRFFGDPQRSIRMKYDLVPVLDGLGEGRWAAATLSDLAQMVADLGDFPEARRLADDALTRRRVLGDVGGIAHAVYARALVEFAAGNFAAARDLFEEAQPLAEKAGWAIDAAEAVAMIGECARRCGDVAGGKKHLRQALLLLRDLGQRLGVPELLQEAAALAERPHTAARILAASDRLLGELGVARWDPTDYEHTLATTRKRLGEDAFDLAWREGLSLTEHEAIDLALRSLQQDAQ